VRRRKVFLVEKVLVHSEEMNISERQVDKMTRMMKMRMMMMTMDRAKK